MSIFALVILRVSTNWRFPTSGPRRWLYRSTSRSRFCCQRADAACSCPAPVGRRSWWSMPTAARQTATSPRRAAVEWLPGGAHTGFVNATWPVARRSHGGSPAPTLCQEAVALAEHRRWGTEPMLRSHESP